MAEELIYQSSHEGQEIDDAVDNLGTPQDTSDKDTAFGRIEKLRQDVGLKKASMLNLKNVSAGSGVDIGVTYEALAKAVNDGNTILADGNGNIYSGYVSDGVVFLTSVNSKEDGFGYLGISAYKITKAGIDTVDIALDSEKKAPYLGEDGKLPVQVLPAFEDMVSYGIEYDVTVSSPECTRIGNSDLHRSLPIHSKMRGCLLDDNGNVVEYLDPRDWTGQVRDGSRGQVMVELPMYYRKFETDGNKRRVKISEYPLPGYHQVKKKYVSAYEATVQRSTTTLCSVVNEDADYRGGNNNAEWDGTYRSLLGRPATSISRTNFRTYARKRKSSTKEWNCMTYDIHKDLFWLFIIEYATLNSQKAFNSAKDSSGYAQGGLGNGVTNLNSTKWSEFNGYYPFIPCGYTDELGNGTGEVEFSMPEEYDSAGLTVKVPRYRGIENPFGHLWQWTDGINVRISPNEPTGDGLSKVFVTDNPEYFNDSNYNNMSHVGNEARTESYVKEVIFGEGGEIMPSVVDGGSTTYFCDYHYTNIPTTETLRGVLFGGVANNGAYAGFGYALSNYAPSNSSADFGSRLCFIPA